MDDQNQTQLPEPPEEENPITKVEDFFITEAGKVETAVVETVETLQAQYRHARDVLKAGEEHLAAIFEKICHAQGTKPNLDQ